MREKLVVLVAEDEGGVLCTAQALQKAAISDNIQFVSDGQSAMDYFAGAGKYSDRNAHPLPHFVFLAAELTAKSGLEVLRWIRRQPDLQSVAVMMLSPQQDEKVMKHAYDLGVNAWVAKTIPVEELAAEFKKFYVFWWPIASSRRFPAWRNPRERESG